VRTAQGNANANRPKGAIDGPVSLDSGRQRPDFGRGKRRRLHNNGAPVRLGDVGSVTDSVGHPNGSVQRKPAVLIIIASPGANIIATVDRARHLPTLRASISPALT
jgi:multidrug efflux pump subunit AcrB